jgi:1-acyl-sn-glycerol-3-phosphate acyltransferase
MTREQLMFKLHKSIVKGYARTLLNYDLLMDEVLPDGPKIIVANHPTTTDPFLLPILVNDPITILVTGMAFEVPVFGRMLHSAGHIPVEKPCPNAQLVVDAAVEKLASGGTIGLFPEGCLSPKIGQVSRLKTGAARIALQSGVQVIPVGIHLSPNAYFEKAMQTEGYEATCRIFYRGSNYITVGKALHFEQTSLDRAVVREVSSQIHDAIANQVNKSAARMETAHVKWTPLFPFLSHRYSN